MKVQKKVLIIGSSSGYGLATRISLAFGAGAETIGVAFEKGVEGKRVGSAGLVEYNCLLTKLL